MEWLDGNARNWAYTSRCILEDHYKSCIETISEKLKTQKPTDWRKLLSIASRWATCNLVWRMEKDTIQRTEALLVSLFDEVTQPT